jgi:hypothetical protein
MPTFSGKFGYSRSSNIRSVRSVYALDSMSRRTKVR